MCMLDQAPQDSDMSDTTESTPALYLKPFEKGQELVTHHILPYVLNHTPENSTTTVLRPFFWDHPGELCQKRTSGLHDARKD